MLLTLLKALGSKSLDEVVSKISLSPLDIDVLLYEAQEAGDVEVNREKNTIKKIIRFYDQQEANIVRSRLEMVAVDPMGVYGYPKHDFYCTLYYLEQSGEVNKYDISVRKRGSRPAHTFEFYTFLDHQEFGAKAVNNFIEQFDKK
jgi:hypothetical protein